MVNIWVNDYYCAHVRLVNISDTQLFRQTFLSYYYEWVIMKPSGYLEDNVPSSDNPKLRLQWAKVDVILSLGQYFITLQSNIIISTYLILIMIFNFYLYILL